MFTFDTFENENMKRLMHLCFTSKNEVLCRNSRDYKMMISRIAQSAFRNDTDILAYAVMSNHVHIIVQTEKEAKFIKTLKSSYTQSFNHIYKRKGSLGDDSFYRLELEGIQHQQDAITYVLQNPWHHKVTDNPFDYPYSSINLYYRRNHLEQPLNSACRDKNKRLLNRNVNINAPVEYGPSGMVAPESFVQIRMVENIFGTYTSFHMLTHRKNYKEWKDKQQLENQSLPIVNFHSVEPLLSREQIKAIEENPYRWRKGGNLTDAYLCQIIDGEILSKYKCGTYTQLHPNDKKSIIATLMAKYPYRITEEQLLRCLGGY